MAKYKVSFPNQRKDFTGVYYGVTFNQGIGETDNPWLASRFEEKGLTVTEEVAEVFQCPHCEKKYKSVEALEKHIEEKHPTSTGDKAE